MFSSILGHFVTTLKSTQNEAGWIYWTETGCCRKERTKWTSLDLIPMFSLASCRFVRTLKLAQNGAGCSLRAETGYRNSELTRMNNLDPIFIISSIFDHPVIDLKSVRNGVGAFNELKLATVLVNAPKALDQTQYSGFLRYRTVWLLP
jgi:hypothetical protein